MTEGKIETGFLAMVERATRPDNPNLEELHRKNQFQQICTEECTYKTCPYHNPDHYGQACEMQWQPKKTKEKQSLPHDCALEGLERSVEKLVDKLLEPHERRLRKLESTPQYNVRQSNPNAQFNGRFTLKTLRGDTIYDD